MDAAHYGEGSATREREAVMQQPAGTIEARQEGLNNEKGGGMPREAAMQQPAGTSEAWHDKSVLSQLALSKLSGLACSRKKRRSNMDF